MKEKIASLTIILFLFIANSCGYDSYQTFESAGFKVKCGCKFYENTVFIETAELYGADNIIAAYVCAEKEDNPNLGVVNNINIYDESKNYKNLEPSEYSSFEEMYLKQYAEGLANMEISYTYTTYQDVSAIEYTFYQDELPTKSIFFLKNKKSYLLQVGTRKDLTIKFDLLKSNFVLL